MNNVNLRVITEDFWKAQTSRRKDFFMVKKSNRKVMTIHLGGIYLECLLKSIIVKQKGIIKDTIVTQELNGKRCKYVCWYDSCACSAVSGMPTVDDNTLFSQKTTINPEHNLVQAFKQIAELNNGAPTDIVRKLSFINKPFNRKYIDYRYMGDDEITDTDYDFWETNFIGFISYFNHRKGSFSFKL